MVENPFASGGEFRFRMGLQRTTLPKYFPTVSNEALIERTQWIEDPRFLQIQPGGDALVHEAVELLLQENRASETGVAFKNLTRHLEPDLVLLADEEGGFRIRAGAVCFPSFWSLEEKMGQGMAAIHGPVPTLNHQLGPSIDTFLRRLQPGDVWERWNWGLAATTERNCHPSLERPRLTDQTPFDEIRLRIEHQAFLRLPVSGGVLFAIRVIVQSLRQRSYESADFAEGLLRTLQTMPQDILHYKGLDQAKERIVARLQGLTGAAH